MTLFGQTMANLPTFALARRGVRLVPQGRRIFGSLTVKENLAVSQRHAKAGSWTQERVLEQFPRLTERLNVRAAALSGGEQQMLAISRALLGNPGLLLMDEPTEGLAPMIVRQIADVVEEIRRSGVTVLVVEQNEGFIRRICDSFLVMRRGQLETASLGRTKNGNNNDQPTL
jgi:branched-chain amino acid transport system ATP-binding protein